MRYLRHAMRSLARAPSFSLAVILTFGISVAAVAAVYSVADGVLLRALPFRNASRLLWITSIRPQRTDAPFTLAEFMDYRERSRTLDLAGFTSWNAALSTSEQA